MAMLFLLGMWVFYFCVARKCLRMSAAAIKAGGHNSRTIWEAVLVCRFQTLCRPSGSRRTGQRTMSDLTSPVWTGQFETWQELERALSIVHVAGLELIAEIKTDGEQSESATRQRFDDALVIFHDSLGKLGYVAQQSPVRFIE